MIMTKLQVKLDTPEAKERWRLIKEASADIDGWSKDRQLEAARAFNVYAETALKSQQSVSATDFMAGYASKAEQTAELRAEVERLTNALRHVFSVGHNLECIFCGFKDKYATEALADSTDGGGE